MEEKDILLEQKIYFQPSQFNILEWQDAIARAQLKKVVEWGNQDCTEHDHTPIVSGFSRFMCWECTGELLKIVGVNDG